MAAFVVNIAKCKVSNQLVPQIYLNKTHGGSVTPRNEIRRISGVKKGNERKPKVFSNLPQFCIFNEKKINFDKRKAPLSPGLRLTGSAARIYRSAFDMVCLFPPTSLQN